MFCSDEKCTPGPEECRDIIPYTTIPNRLYGLNTTEEYENFATSIENALRDNCTMDESDAKWGVCNMMFPRCLLGWELQFCQEACLGMNL